MSASYYPSSLLAKRALLKRLSSTSGDVDPEFKEFMPPMDEFFHYNRFVLGYQVPGTDEKHMVVVLPNGEIKLFDQK